MAAVSLDKIERDGVELRRQVQLVRSLLEEIETWKRTRKTSED